MMGEPFGYYVAIALYVGCPSILCYWVVEWMHREFPQVWADAVT